MTDGPDTTLHEAPAGLHSCPSGFPAHRFVMQLQLGAPHSSAQLLVEMRVQVVGACTGASQIISYQNGPETTLHCAPSGPHGCPSRLALHRFRIHPQLGTPH